MSLQRCAEIRNGIYAGCNHGGGVTGAGILWDLSMRAGAKLGRYTVAVKVIDIFGNDTITLVPVNVG